MIIVVENGPGDLSSFLDETVCISYSANIPQKDMHPTILTPAMGK